MKMTFLLLIALLNGIAGACQPDTTQIVRFSELSYNSYFEQLAFMNYREGNRDYLELLMAVDPSVNTVKYNIVAREIELELQKLKNKRFFKAKPEKKITLLYEQVNKDIFQAYKENVLFSQIFDNGTFNCLTATGYYGVLLDSLGIPYLFRESFNHVHPVAYPDNSGITIETTDPVTGVRYFDEKLKVRFVNYLLETSRVSREEYDTTGVDVLFNRYYLPERSIGLAELTGLQYMNDALNRYATGDYLSSFEQIKKAYFLYPSNKMLAVFQFILNSAIYESNFMQLSDARFIVYMARLIKKDVISTETVAGTFGYMSNIVVITRTDTQLYDSIYHYLVNNLDEPDLKDNIELQYSLFRGKAFLSNYMLKDALNLFERAYELDDDNLEVQTLFVTTLAYTFQNSSNKEIIQRIDTVTAKFPNLDSNGLFLSLKMMAYLAYVEELFDFGNPGKALDYLGKFEAIYEDNPGLEINYKLVGDAYSAAAVYFFKKYNKKKARELLEKGLQIAPGNFELRYRLNSL